MTYFSFIDQCNQDMMASSCVFKHNLKQFHAHFLQIETIHCRNNNAGCYAGASAIMAKKEICDSFGIKLESVNFNEAQKGKDQCDRDGAVAKRKIRTYVNEGHDVTNAVNVKKAVDAPPGVLKNSKSCVIEIDYPNSRPDKIKIKDVSRYHYFQVEEMGIGAWEFEEIGPGKLLQLQDMNFNGSLKVVKSFSGNAEVRTLSQSTEQKTSKKF